MNIITVNDNKSTAADLSPIRAPRVLPIGAIINASVIIPYVKSSSEQENVIYPEVKLLYTGMHVLSKSKSVTEEFQIEELFLNSTSNKYGEGSRYQ